MGSSTSAPSSTAPSKPDVPSSIIIVGSGVFGLSTAWALTQRPEFSSTTITLVDRAEFPAPDAASVDSSRIVRADYADPAYTSLMRECSPVWRGEFGAEGRYTENGLCIVMDPPPTSTAVVNSGAGGDGGACEYMAHALQNVQAKLGLRVGPRDQGGQLTLLSSAAAVSATVPGMTGDVGSHGYVNWTSGWADAEAGLRHLRRLVESTRRVTFYQADVHRLLIDHATNSVLGVGTTSREALTADLTILAAGAWTPRLIDLRGVASASGQVLTYLSLSPGEESRLASHPTLLNESSGMFIIPPRHGVLKVARHGYGYANFVSIPHPERNPHVENDDDDHDDQKITVSLPRTKHDDPTSRVPAEGEAACRAYLSKTIPWLADRPFTHTRICWYTDTVSGNWLIDYHPRYANLFLATGGSGHAYKFLPVIGDRIVDVLVKEERDELGGVLREKWRWPQTRAEDDHVWTADWRGGRKGMVLEEELARSREEVGGCGK